MAKLGGPLVFALGGEGLSGGKPWVVNLAPVPGSENVKLLQPIRLSVRDAESYIDPGTLLVEVAYAKLFSNADELFDVLPRTNRRSLISGSAQVDPILVVSGSGVEITKSVEGAERSVYTTALDAGPGFGSVCVSAVIQPITNAPAVTTEGPLNQSVFPGFLLPLPYSTVFVPTASGTVLGLEHGARNKVVYVWFEGSGAARKVRITGYLPSDETNSPLDLSQLFDWSQPHRYSIFWNETLGYVEVYSDIGGESLRLFKVPIASVPSMPSDYYAKVSGGADVVALYGQEGPTGNKSIWSNIAFTTDVGYPLIGTIRPGSYKTKRLGAEMVRMPKNLDPRELDIAPWFSAPALLYANPDPIGRISPSDEAVKITKATLGKTTVLSREEPGFLRSSTDGLVLEATISAVATQQEQAGTGMGFVIYDGQSVFQLQLFNDFATKTIGLRKLSGDDVDITEQTLPITALDWGSPVSFRFVVDPRQSNIKMFALPDLNTAIMNIPLDRSQYQTAADRGWAGDTTPFIAVGQITETNTLGTLYVHDLAYCHLYQAWDADGGFEPHHVNADPIFEATNSGAGTPTLAMVDGRFQINCPARTTSKFRRAASFGPDRGAILEARLRITSHRTQSRTGVLLLLDDGINSFAVGFTENATGKYVAFSVSDGLSGFKEIAGRDGLGAKLSVPCDWSQSHTYRLERRPHEGLYLTIDEDIGHRLFMPEADFGQLAISPYSTPTIGFGQFSGESAVSEWEFIHTLFSSGYEVSFKKNKPDHVLLDELFGSQVIVVATALDQD